MNRIHLLTRSPFWAITREGAAVLAAQCFGPELTAVRMMLLRTQYVGRGDNRTAIIPIQGTLTRGEFWAGTTYGAISTGLEQAATDASVKRIVLAVDSPGGEVTGLPETAALLAQVAKAKPVHAIVEGTSASAAYWLTSQATDITANPSAEVGSIGVRMMHVDVSKYLDDAGFKVTEMFAGQYKTEWSPYQPLSDDAKADMQTRLDKMHGDFLSAVTTGRPKATAEIQAARFGEGRMFSAQDALGHGMVDRVQSSREFFQAILPPQEETAVAPPYGLQKQRTELERARFPKV